MTDFRYLSYAALLAPTILLGGCQDLSGGSDPRQALQPILAREIELVVPLTQPSSFDDDALPEGLSVVLRATDPEGDPAKLAGRMVFELYTFRPASADPKGDLIQTWTHELATARDQREYWNRVTRMYEFPLSLDRSQVPRRLRFVVRARYTTPWDEHVETQATLDYTELLAEVRRQLRRPPAGGLR